MDSPLECRLTDIVESIPAGFLMCDPQDRIVACNSLFKQWFFPGCEDRLRLGMTYRELLEVFIRESPSAMPDRDEQWVERRLARRGNSEEPFEHRIADGRVLRSSEKRTADGFTISIHVDMTELHRQKEAADVKSEQLKVILESIDQGISMFDGNLDVVAFNARFLDLLEFPEDLGKTAGKFQDFIRFNAERGEYGEGDIDKLVEERVELAKQFQPHRFERIRPDGTVMEIHGTPISGGGMVTTYTDITEAQEKRRGADRAEPALQRRARQHVTGPVHVRQGPAACGVQQAVPGAV